MASIQLLRRNNLVDWQVAPSESELANYDEPKIRYRKLVQEFIEAVPKKSLKKKSFITISTNVLCAEIKSSKEDIDPIDRDIYLPLEIALTKWNVSDANKPPAERSSTTSFWLVNPGDIPSGCINHALDHKKTHKIEYDKLKDGDDVYVENDLQKIVKGINSFLLPDRVVFSVDVGHCRQDLGCLKWLNRETNYTTKPIKVYSLEDLYVVLIRELVDDKQIKLSVCQGLARHKLRDTSSPYESKLQCPYHRYGQLQDDTDSCTCCAKAVAQSYTSVLLDDIMFFTIQLEDSIKQESPDKAITDKAATGY